jgi:hypothetical protein
LKIINFKEILEFLGEFSNWKSTIIKSIVL